MGPDRRLFTINQLLQWTSGSPLDGGDLSVLVSSVCVDSRACTDGSLFVALPGARTNGHLFLSDARDRGAVAALVQEAESEKPNGEDDLIRIYVPDTLAALQNAARNFLDHFPDVVRIGVTGSNGKTTTKEILASILREEMRTYCSAGNLNSDSGLPLAVFSMPEDSEVAIFEMGMNRAGEISELAAVCRPDVAMVTNIGTAHVGNLGSADRIAEEKKAIASHFSGNEVLFVPDEGPYSEMLGKDICGEVIRFGFSAQKARFVDQGDNGRLRLPGIDVAMPLSGRHNANNVLAAIAVAQRLNVSSAAIARGVLRVKLPPGRSEILEGSRLIFNDTYNANPQSMIASINAFDALVKTRQIDETVIVLGEMGELGSFSEEGHAAVVERACASRPRVLCLVGTAMQRLADEAASGLAGEVLWGESVSRVKPLLAEHLRPGQAVLLKGSRAVGLEALLDLVLDTPSEREERHA